jgi:hypothetical protein
MEEGTSIHGNKMLTTQARAKRCYMALVKDYPDTAVDAAATQLLMSTISTTFQQTVSCYPTAHRGYNHILDKFTGGKNQEANYTWQQEMREGIKPQETLDEYVLRMEGLYNCLVGNGMPMMPHQGFKDLILGLPAEMDQAKYPLMGNLAGKDWPRVLPAIKAMAYMMDYSDKSRTEEATANFANKGPGAAGNRPAGQQQRPKSPARDRKPPFCKRCFQPLAISGSYACALSP